MEYYNLTCNCCINIEVLTPLIAKHLIEQCENVHPYLSNIFKHMYSL